MTTIDFTYASLVTLLQFSLGANLAFATVLTLYDKVLVRKQKTILDLKVAASKIKERHNGDLDPAATQAIRDVDKLALDISRFAKNIEHVTYDWFRHIALGCAFLALGLLIFAIYNTHEQVGLATQALSFTTIAPLFAFSAYALVWTSYRIWIFDNRRNRLDTLLATTAAGQ